VVGRKNDSANNKFGFFQFPSEKLRLEKGDCGHLSGGNITMDQTGSFQIQHRKEHFISKVSSNIASNPDYVRHIGVSKIVSASGDPLLLCHAHYLHKTQVPCMLDTNLNSFS